MRCDVVAIGTELLLGQIVDTNSAWLGEQLSAAGIDSCLQVKVGDNLERMVKAIRSTLADADAVIICGGLGPTHDDITREAIAEIMGVELEFDDAVGMAISEMFASRNRRMPEINMRQAMVPKGAAIIEQRRGTAPGLICPVGDKVIYAVPGVPYELYEMFERAILPDLLMRSHPLAKNASVGLPTLSSCSITPKRRSFNPLSLSPHVRNTRLEITDAEPERISKSGNIARSNISYNSYGTPGTA